MSSEKITELKPGQPPKPSPEQQRANELQAKVNVASAVFMQKVRAAHTAADGTVMVDFLKMYSGQMLFEAQFNAIVNALIKYGMPADVLLQAMLDGIQTKTAEIIRQTILNPQAGVPNMPKSPLIT